MLTETFEYSQQDQLIAPAGTILGAGEEMVRTQSQWMRRCKIFF